MRTERRLRRSHHERLLVFVRAAGRHRWAVPWHGVFDDIPRTVRLGDGGLERGHPGTRREPKTRPTREGASTETRGVPVRSWFPSAGAAPSAPGSGRAGFLRPSAIFAFLYRPKVYVAFLRCFGDRRGRDRAPGGIRGLAGGEDGGGLAGLADEGSHAIPDARAGAAAGESPILVPGALARAIDSRDFSAITRARRSKRSAQCLRARFDTAPRVRAGRSRAVPPTGRAGLRTTPETCALALTARSRRPAGRHVRARSTFAEAPVPAVASSENEVACRARGSFYSVSGITDGRNVVAWRGSLAFIRFPPRRARGDFLSLANRDVM